MEENEFRYECTNEALEFKTLPLQSKYPPVLKAYAYIALQTTYDYCSRHPLIQVPHQDQSSSDVDIISLCGLQVKCMLGEGSGKTLLCEFGGDIIALKITDLTTDLGRNAKGSRNL
ncbi:9101_t:CDS:2 [Ambispora gerdemannii]|uniref:9101_t:CDS:1 n=1 Tax=Ambispora gerdemannii TaxID=144530 RepID=A0A9N9BC40_9GLOM|nr:9101_t:CDS:2 [Ambispora gerdemannii]